MIGIMRIILDDRELEPCQGTAADGLERARAASEADHRIVSDVFLDDARLTDAEISELSGSDRSGSVLRCTTANPVTLVLDTFEFMDSALGQLTSLQEEAATKLQEGSTEAALGLLGSAIQQWCDIQVGVDQGCRLLGLDFDQIRREEKQVGIAVEVLTNSLQDLRQAVALSDWSRVSDTLGYEMPDVVVKWRHLVEYLSDRVEHRQSGGAGA